jgi:beta-lactam-binding protein with PASTA domain
MDIDGDLIDAGVGVRTPGIARAAVGAFADWLRPKGRRSRNVTVPVLTGMRIGEGAHRRDAAGVKLEIVRLVEPPAAVEGYVIGQRAPPGTVVRRRSTVTLDVFHGPR